MAHEVIFHYGDCQRCTGQFQAFLLDAEQKL